MTDLENFYREHLEEDIITALSEKLDISAEKAMKMYYNSEFADKIHDGVHGIQYLDCEILADIIIKARAIGNEV